MEKPYEKFFVIGRRDLEPGLRSAQLGHAAVAFALAHKETLEQRWEGNLILLEVDSLDALETLYARLGAEGAAAFREPDLGGELTAIAVLSTPEARRATSSLPRAFRGTRVLRSGPGLARCG